MAQAALARHTDTWRTTGIDSLPRPCATLLIPDGGVLATRVHYETLNDAMFLLRVTLLSTVLCLVSVIMLSLATANVDIKLGIMAITSYPKLIFSSSVWSSTSVFSAIQVAWFMAYCAFSHIIRLHFNTTDPPRDWDDRNGAWSVVELDVRVISKPAMPRSIMHPPSAASLAHHRHLAAHGTSSHSHVSLHAPEVADLEDGVSAVLPIGLSSRSGASTTLPLPKSASDQWKLCVQPTQHTGAAGIQADITLLTPDQDYLAWRARHKRKNY
ncbi:hypothetical protein LPJ66_005283 [Kickxella alabastrina]|uniref:Uncharacterized protein n=1 Tax=Kickxella alabastrina TaxID=61397 RepID=A0ACC1IHB7_9FUNG|nr:hypothetical protein LPJ66_005283 [Kickxella alabastrina]